MKESIQTFISHVLDLLNIRQGFFDYLQSFSMSPGYGQGERNFHGLPEQRSSKIIFVQLYPSIPNSKLCPRAHTSWDRPSPEHNVCP
jgi:hypothetical protein